MVSDLIPTLPATFLIARHFPNQARREARNVGVILLHSKGVYAQFYGEEYPGNVDSRRIRDVIKDTKTYEQWVGYWRHCIEPANELESLKEGLLVQNLLDQCKVELISSSRANYEVSVGGQILLEGLDFRDPAVAVMNLYTDLIQEKEVEEAQSDDFNAESRMRQIVTDSRLEITNLLQPQPNLRVTGIHGGTRSLKPDYIYVRNQYNVLWLVELPRERESAAETKVDSMLYKYDLIVRHAKNANRRESNILSLVDSRQDRYGYDISPYLEQLDSFGATVDLSKPDDAIKTLEALKDL